MTTQQPTVSVIIPHHNGEEILRDCLRSLYQTTQIPLEVIVVDNASTDRSALMVREEFPTVRLLSLLKNRGFAGGCNEGIRHASSDFVLILNNDTIHQTGWIEFMLNKIQSSPDIAVVQPKLLSYQNRDMFDYSGAGGGEMDIFAFPFARGRIFETNEIDKGQYDALDERIFWASGTAFLARRNLILAAGLLDETFFAHMEEIDLDWRLQLMGYSIVVEPKAVIWHRSGYTLGADSPRKKYLNHRNSLLMFLANYRLLLTLYLLPMRIALDVMALIFSVLRGDVGRASAIFKAHVWILIHSLTVWKKRQLVRSIRRKNDSEILSRLYHGASALSYYLFGKKKYSLLVR